MKAYLCVCFILMHEMQYNVNYFFNFKMQSLKKNHYPVLEPDKKHKLFIAINKKMS